MLGYVVQHEEENKYNKRNADIVRRAENEKKM